MKTSHIVLTAWLSELGTPKILQFCWPIMLLNMRTIEPDLNTCSRSCINTLNLPLYISILGPFLSLPITPKLVFPSFVWIVINMHTLSGYYRPSLMPSLYVLSYDLYTLMVWSSNPM